MTRGAYYNEIEPFAADWLRRLIVGGLIPVGEVDERSIRDVQPEDLRGFTQCHFFAGIGGWALAARLAGWPDDRPLWTGSCPCQPFSVAGQQKGQDDERHLWPEQFRLIRACRPPVWVGEQVAAAVGKDWLDGVSADLEGIHYASRAVVVPACAVKAPHRRDRLWIVADGSLIVADANGFGSQGAEPVDTSVGGRRFTDAGAESPWAGTAWLLGADGKARRVGTDFRRMVDGFSSGVGRLRSDLIASAIAKVEAYGQTTVTGRRSILRAVWDTVLAEPETYRSLGESPGVCGPEILLAFLCQLHGRGLEGNIPLPGSEAFARTMRGLRWADRQPRASRQRGRSGQLPNQHSDPVQTLSRVLAQHAEAAWSSYRQANASSLELLKRNVPGRVGRLRAYGNAIVPPLASEVLGAYLDVNPT